VRRPPSRRAGGAPPRPPIGAVPASGGIAVVHSQVYDAFRPFARFMSPSEHEELVRGIILEQRLRKRITQLQEYRREGITTVAESLEYEAGRKKREQLLAAGNSQVRQDAVGVLTFLPHWPRFAPHCCSVERQLHAGRLLAALLLLLKTQT
jgi:hypothetical protein